MKRGLNWVLRKSVLSEVLRWCRCALRGGMCPPAFLLLSFGPGDMARRSMALILVTEPDGSWTWTFERAYAGSHAELSWV